VQKTPYKFYPVVPIEEYIDNVTTLPGKCCSPAPLHTTPREHAQAGVASLTDAGKRAEKELYDVAKKCELNSQAAEKEETGTVRLRGGTLTGSLRRKERRRPGLDEWMPQAFLHAEKQLKELEKQVPCILPISASLYGARFVLTRHHVPSLSLQEKKLQRNISFRAQQKGQRNRSSTYSG
jgi:hypothetical protein